MQPASHDHASIVNLTGLAATGKSVVLRQLYEQFAPSVPTIWIDCAPQATIAGKSVPSSFAEIVAELSDRVDALEYLSIEQVPPEERDSDYIAPPDGSLWAALQMSVAGVDASSPLVVLIDHINELRAWKWLQQAFVLPLQEQPALIICASRDELSWDYWPLRNACTRQEIPPFTVAEASAYFAQQHGYIVPTHVIPTLITDELYPYALQEELREFQKQIGDWPLPEPLPLMQLPAEDPLLYYCGWLRIFQIDVMMEMLAWPALEAALALPGEPRARRSMLRATLTRWRAAQYIYVYDSTERLIYGLRRMLAEHIAGHEPEFYRAIVHLAAEIYARRVRAVNTTSEKIRSFLEWLYYSTTPGLLARSSDAQVAWEAELQTMLQQAGLAGSVLAISLYSDQDVVRRLDTAGQLAIVDRYLQEMAARPEALSTTEQRKRRQAIQQRILTNWNNDPTLDPVKTAYPGGVKELLVALDRRADEFDCFTMKDLRDILQQAGVSQAARRPMVRAIQEAGLVQYHQDRQQFILESAARSALGYDATISGQSRSRHGKEDEHGSTV
jgi:hypothetical protein